MRKIVTFFIGKLLVSVAAVVLTTALAGAAAEPAPTDTVKANEEAYWCDAYLPSNGHGGTTYLVVHVDTAGNFSRAGVLRSSGDTALDAAAVSCANKYHISPKQRNGAAIAFDWIVILARVPGYHAYLLSPNPKTGSPNACASDDTPARSGNVTLAYTILEDGSVSAVAVTTSSGNASVDAAAVACVKRYQYYPAYQNGKPITVEWSSGVRFSLGPPP